MPVSKVSEPRLAVVRGVASRHARTFGTVSTASQLCAQTHAAPSYCSARAVIDTVWKGESVSAL